MAEKNQNQEEEIDLGNLFKVIGSGINNFFNGIGRIFRALFHLIILFLIFLRSNALKLGISLFLGAVVGYFIEVSHPKEYVSNLIVETNHGSGVQLYKQIGFLDDLLIKRDTLSLAKALNITSKEASQLTHFKISAYQKRINLYKSYDDYLQNTDTIFTKGFKVEDFKKRFDEYDYRYHELIVKSNSKEIFRKVSLGVKALVENDYLKRRRDLKNNELKLKLGTLRKNLTQIDSLRSLYSEVALKEAEKTTSNSTIEFSQKQFDNSKNDLELFNTSNRILLEIEKLNSQILKSENILNIISDFNEVGVSNNKIAEKKYFQFAVLFGSLMMLLILLLQLNRYLVNYKK